MFKLLVVQAEHGDSLILSYGAPEHPRYILIDGGPSDTYDDHLKIVLEKIRDQGSQLDRVILSHVDDDHVNGLLDFFQDMQWQRSRNKPETIGVSGLWLNTFSQTLGNQVTTALERSMDEAGEMRALMPTSGNRARSIRQGSQLTGRAATLDIPLNPDFAGEGLICSENAQEPIEFANLKLHVVSPTQTSLGALQEDWEKWLKKQAEKQAALEEGAAERAASDADASVPNLSSIMLMAEADGKTMLLTGDGLGDHLLQGLEQAGLLPPAGRLHVDVFKLPHHGSVRNVSPELFDRVTADTYVICANGKHDNPDYQTLEWLVEAALAQSRAFKLVATTRTDSIDALVQEYEPSNSSYEVISLPPDAHALTITLSESG
jgi:beta-lactamase superfamily II metal-dependent hydrolase